MGPRGGKQGTADTARWLQVPANPGEAELRESLDQAAARGADEVALRRVWARLAETECLVPMASDRSVPFDRATSRRVRWPWIVAASLAGAATTLAFMLVQTKSEVRVATAVPSQPATVPAVVRRDVTDQRSTLVAPATVRTGFGETLHLALRGGTEVTVTSESALVLDDEDRPSVSVGEVQFHVPPQPAGRTFVVTAGAYRVVVVGTRFRVRVNQTNAAIGVDEGTVEIWSDHRIARINAGESWVGPSPPQTLAVPGGPNGSAPDSVVSPSVIGVSRAVRAAGSVRGSAVGTSTRKAGSRTRARQEARQEARQASKQVLLALSSPAAAFSGVPTASSTIMSTPSPTVGAGPSVGAGSSPTTGDVSMIGPPRVVAVPLEAAPLAVQARAARAAGDSRRALDLYRSLAQKGGAAGENAEYEMGRVLRDDLHQPAEAVTTWRSYRTQHPRGLLRIEADISVIETLVTVGDKSGALTEGSEFIRRYPDSERRMEIARLTGDLLRERGDCSGAISAYDVAMSSGRGRKDVADSVSFHRSTCLLRGDRNAGVAALRTYLQSFPAGHFRVDAQRLLADVPSLAPTATRP